jgi:hypothetical protein
VGAEPHGPSPPPLHRLGRRPVAGEVDLLEKGVPLPREGHIPALSREVPRLSQKSLREKEPPVRWRGLLGFVKRPLRKGVGGLFQASLQRGHRPSSAISGGTPTASPLRTTASSAWSMAGSPSSGRTMPTAANGRS